jgi:hypothetical protein
MKTKFNQWLAVILVLLLAFLAGTIFSRPSADPISSAVVTAKDAKADNAAWEPLQLLSGRNLRHQDMLTGVAVINRVRKSIRLISTPKKNF